ncbi:MAG TPA: glycosyltransferase family 4 protein [Thermoleophilaceae bacterium]
MPLSGRRPLHLVEIGLRWPPETFLCWKLEGLAARGMRVTVASRTIFEPEARLDGVELIHLPQVGRLPGRLGLALRLLALFLTAPRRALTLLRAVRRVPRGYREYRGGYGRLLGNCLPLARLRPDIVHFEWNSAAALYLPLFDVWRCPVVTSCHGSEVSLYPHVPGHEFSSERLPAVFAGAAAVHCVSESLREEAQRFGLEPGKARVIRQGVDPELFRPNGGPPPGEAPLRVISVAWLRWMKGFEWALIAVRRLLEAGVPVRLEVIGGDPTEEIGEPSERARIAHTLSDLGLEDHVHLLGKLSSADVAARLQASDVLLLPSLDEGLPTVLLEAMASGIPVVATDCGGVSESFTHELEGLLVPPRDAAAMAGALERLWRDPALRARMGEAGRRTATTRFTLDRQLEEFHALYRELAAA